MKRVLSFLLLSVLCGCGAGYQFSPYVGQQQNWQIGTGGYVKQVDNATFYPPGQFPVRPYVIIGSVSTDSEGNLAKAVHEQKADAALIYTDQTVRTGTVAVGGPVLVPTGGGRVFVGPNVFGTIPLTKHTINAQLIKFK